MGHSDLRGIPAIGGHLLTLDTRQRAMLEAMRVPVWLPHAQPAAVAPGPAVADADAMNSIADDAAWAGAAAPFDTKASVPAAVPALAGGYALLPLVQPYAAPAGGSPDAAWLVVVEAESGKAGSPFRGEAGQLLDAMLRALRLHRQGNVHLARLVRAGTAPAEDDAAAALAHGMAQLRPAVVLAMGRAATQLLLGTSEPLGRLRGRPHDAGGVPVVVTYDSAYLLRAQPDKARAWADLCLARAIALGRFSSASGSAVSEPTRPGLP